MRKAQDFTREDITKESMKLEAKSEVSPDLRAALIDEESGVLRAGLLPNINAATPAGAKHLLNSLTQAGRGSFTAAITICRQCILVWVFDWGLVDHLHT